MAQLRHIAITASDPLHVADLFEELFGCTKLRYDAVNGYAVVTDGYMHFAISKTKSDGSQRDGAIDHVGFYVDDLEASRAIAEAKGLPETKASYPATRFYEAADGWEFEFRQSGWVETIQAHTALLDLEPVATDPTVRLQHPPTDFVEDGPSGYVRVGEVADLPVGSAVRVDIEDRGILIVNVDNVYCAVQDECPHMPRFGRLSEGKREGAVVECPIHCSHFDVRTGDVLVSPAKRDLRTFETRIVGGTVWVKNSNDGAAARDVGN